MGKNPEQKYALADLKPIDPHGLGIKWGMLLLAFCLSLLVYTFAGCEAGKKAVPVSISADEKKAALNRQLNIKFENPDAHYELGRLFQAEGNWAKAEYHYNVALSFDPAHRPAQAAMVKGLISNGNKAKAEQNAKSYMNQASISAMASLELAEAFKEQQLDQYALACYQQALRLEPNSPEVNKQLGYYYLSKKDTEHAKEYFSRSFQLNPNQPDVSGELGRLGVVIKIPERPKK